MTSWVLGACVLVVVSVALAVIRRRSHAGNADVPGGQSERYARFRNDIEPRLIPRIHRFAAPPVIAEPGSAGAPVAVCIEPHEDRDAARTRASLERQTRPAACVFEGTPADALTATNAPWLAVVRAGDEFAPQALELLGQAALLAPDALMLTCDEDELGSGRKREGPRLRPGPSPDLLLANDLTSSLVCIRRRNSTSLANGAWRYRDALSVGGPGAAGLAHVPSVLCHAPHHGAGFEAEVQAVKEALPEWQLGRAVVEIDRRGRRIRHPLQGEPSVEIILPFRNHAGLLRRCAESLLELTTYEHFSVRLVDNGSDDPDVREVVARLARDRRVRRVRDDSPFNFAALNNAAAAQSDADFLLFLNNDTELLTPTWIEEMLEEAQRPEVGAVAPLLTYPDGTVQHAGAALGLHGYAGHPFAGLSPDQETPFGSATDGTRNWLAVTAACMLVERYKFEQMDGFDESFVVAGNDVDLCLRLTRAGFRSLCVPYVRLEHDESKTRGEHIDPGDFARSEQSYGTFRTVGDPFYNPNLTLQRTDCGPRLPGEL